MATLNLSKMKYMSETNLKKFASLIISLSSQVTDIENKCIKPYVGDELYPRDSYVSYNGYIYQATATNQDSAFDETHWDKLSDDFNELTVADIEAMLGLSQEQLETMANLIADTEVRLDKTYSSSKIYQDIQQCLNDSKSYTLKEIAKLNGSSYKVVTSTSEMTSESIIYLLASGNTYDMYIVEEDGATTKIGDMNIDLSQYVKVTDLENDYLKKTDADGKYATITTVDGKIDKDKIVTALDDSVTDKQVASALLTKTELDKVNASLGELSDSLVDKQDFRVFKSLEEFNEKKGTSLTVVSGVDNMADIVNAMIEGDMLIITTKCTTGSEIYFGLDSSTGWTKMFTFIKANGLCDVECRTTLPSTFKRVLNPDSVLGDWQELATMDKLNYSTVADVPETTVDLTGTDIRGSIKYMVKSGICYVTVWGVESDTTKTAHTLVEADVMPKPIIHSGAVLVHGEPLQKGKIMGQIYIDGSKELRLHIYIPSTEHGGMGYGSFSYPVAES